MVLIKENVNEPEITYKLVPPDGGWGHLITASVTIMNLVTIVPTAAFGLLYGNFLASVGDETTGIALTNGIFNTVQSFTGVGFGLMTPASFSAFISYFDKKLTFMMSVAQAIMVLAAILFPPVIAILLEYFGFRGAVAFLATLALLSLPAMGVLHPVKWHMKKIPLQPIQVARNNTVPEKSKSRSEEILRAQIEPLLSKQLEERIIVNSVDLGTESEVPKFRNNIIDSKPRVSIISLGNKAMSVTMINDLGCEEQRKVSSSGTDLNLLKDPKYLNISCGISLSYTSDAAFIAILPLILNNLGFNKAEVAIMMMVHFGSDFVSRIFISIISAVCPMSNRHMFLAGSIVSAFFRIAFVLNDTYIWKILTLGALGSLRCLIQNPLALVISEEYNDNFATAFSLYMVVCGFVSLVFGPLMSYIKSVTQSDVMVVHLLTVAYLICSVSWIVELLWKKGKHADRKNKTMT
ncbi:hypothetical protein NQ314_000753 [Rhamnusium bicolor]|uniref:Uncharacterized protein n=1 Tax=Rhamnusium bicolor TaxID=1586634 RepID=A0AAV8ZU49_9CUCU|nr:hypothetical protein NQ314_000753 [Rhamnusium bicolor]